MRRWYTVRYWYKECIRMVHLPSFGNRGLKVSHVMMPATIGQGCKHGLFLDGAHTACAQSLSKWDVICLEMQLSSWQSWHCQGQSFLGSPTEGRKRWDPASVDLSRISWSAGPILPSPDFCPGPECWGSQHVQKTIGWQTVTNASDSQLQHNGHPMSKNWGFYLVVYALVKA